MSCLGGQAAGRWAGALPRLELLAGSQAEWAIRRGAETNGGRDDGGDEPGDDRGSSHQRGRLRPGQEEGPRALRDAGLFDALTAGGAEVRDAGDVAAFRWAPDPERPRAANLATVADRARQVGAKVASAGGWHGARARGRLHC